MKRDVGLDLLRIICCLMVIGIHVTPDYSFTVASNLPMHIQIQSLLTQSIVRIGLPVFFMLSGYYLLNRADENLKSFYKRRLTSILIPFFVYSLIHFYVMNYVNTTSQGIGVYFTKIFTSSIDLSVHFWFVYAMVGLYIISPAIKYITNKIPKEDSVNVIIVICIIFYYSLYSYSASQSFSSYHHLIPVQGIDTWVLYFVIGGLLKRVDVNKRYLLIALPVIILVNVIAVYFSTNRFGFNISPYDSGFNMLLACSVFVLAFSKIRINNEGLFCALIERIAPLTYGIYLVHIFVFKSIEKIFNIPFITNALIFKTTYLSLIIFTISACIVALIDKLVIKPILSKM